ncbi:MAG: DUF692 family protein [Phaeodactylibacter sp.]|uniref:multinuclear nonheme iron-dependent oxidase n=1 Tax=Phaeodactylibacter sp. TaxID=1940289 RepID=UPI0032EAA036
MEDKYWQRPRAALACNLDTNLLRAAHPLFAAGQVEALEWSFDALFQSPSVPDWFRALIQAYSEEGRLVGHGVFFSLFAGRWSAEQQQWLDRLKALSEVYRFDHVTEHFGFMTGADFHKGAPLGIPFTPQTLQLGRDRLKRISAAAGCPVGLENLAFAYSLEEVRRHGDFLEQLLEPVNGFIILDVHNLYCQLHNFEQQANDLLRLMPLHRVREIHISGGSWEPAHHDPARQIRRDTHDGAVPDAVFELLELAMPQCPNLKYVVLEQLGGALETTAQQQAFQQDFTRMHRLLSNSGKAVGKPVSRNEFQAPPFTLEAIPPSDDTLHQQQRALSAILENSISIEDARRALSDSPLSGTAWKVEQWEAEMLETARRIAQKWKGGWG